MQLRASRWPIHVVATLVGVNPENFLVQGSTSHVIEVPEKADSEPWTFTLVPQRLGEKTVRVRFEQNNAWVGTAVLRTEVVETVPLEVGEAEVDHMPALSALGQPPDVTFYVEHVSQTAHDYAVSVRFAGDDPHTPEREFALRLAKGSRRT